MKDIDGKLMRTLGDLNVGHYKIQYLPGKSNIVADALSRTIDLTELVGEADESYKVQTTADYVTIPGGPSSVFKCLSYALSGQVDDHQSIRLQVIDRIMKDLDLYGMSNTKEIRRMLLSMKNPDVMPCWQALLAFAHLSSKTVTVYQDGVGRVSFPAHSANGEIHLHSLGGVHFNLMFVKEKSEALVNGVIRASESVDRILYVLEDDETSSEQSEDRCLKHKCSIVAERPMCPEAEVSTVRNSVSSLVSNDQIRDMQASDLELSKLVKWFVAKKTVTWIRENSECFVMYSKLIPRLDDLKVINDILHCGTLPIIPNRDFKNLVLQAHIASGHLGRDKLMQVVRDYYFNLNCTRIVAEVTRECTICQSFKGHARGGEPLCKRKPSNAYDQFAIDLLELEPAKGNVRYLLVGVDVLSRFMSAVPLKDKKASTVRAALEQRIFPTLMKIPDIIISDNGPEFKAREFEQLVTKYDIKHYTTVPYLPHTNGRIERLNRTLQGMLATACAESGRSWIDELPHSLILYNHTKHSQTGKSPAEFFAIDNVKLPLPAGEMWREQTTKFKPYEPGELVGYKVPAYAKPGKLSRRYQGPCKVISHDKRGLVYDIMCKPGATQRKAHYSQLKKWYGRWEETVEELAEETKTPTVAIEENSNLESHVISVDEQLRNRLNFADIFKSVRFTTVQTLSESALTENVPVYSEESQLSEQSGRGYAAPLPLSPELSLRAPPPPPNSVASLSGSQASGETQVAEMENHPSSPQPIMTRARWRRIQENEQRLQEETTGADNSFAGFNENDIMTSTPRRLEVLQGPLDGGDSDLESLVANERSGTPDITVIHLCSTCGTHLNSDRDLDQCVQCMCEQRNSNNGTI